MEGLTIPPPLHVVRIRLLEKGGGNLRDGLLRRGCITHTLTHTHTSEFALFPSLFLSKQERGGRGERYHDVCLHGMLTTKEEEEEACHELFQIRSASPLFRRRHDPGPPLLLNFSPGRREGELEFA